MRVKLAAVLALAFSLISAPEMASAEIRCEAIFLRATSKPPVPTTVSPKTRGLKAKLQSLTAAKFNQEDFSNALASYRSNGEADLNQPATREQRLALLAFFAERFPRNPYDIEHWVRTVDQRSLTILAKSIGPMNFKRGFSPTQVAAMFDRLFAFSHNDPRTFRTLRTQGADTIDQITLEQWAIRETAEHHAVEAFANAGLIKDQKIKQRVLDFLRRNQNITANVGVATANLFQTLLVGFPTIVPVYSRMENQKLDPAIREIFIHHGIEEAYPLLKARYGKYARFDQAYYWASRAATVALTTYFWASYYPVIRSQFMSMGLVNDHATPADMMNAVFAAFGQMLQWGYHEVWTPENSSAATDVGTPGKAPIKPVKAVAAVDDSKTVSSNRGTLDGQASAVETQPLSTDAADSSQPNTPPTVDADAKAMKANLDMLNQLSFDDSK